MDEHAALLTIDAGNRATKAARWERVPDLPGRAPAPSGEACVGHDGSARRALSDFARGARSAFVSCVASSDVRLTVADALADVDVPLVEPPHGLDLASVRNVHTIGADRLFAARGAFALLGRACLVVDAGTAVTVDAVAHSDSHAAAFLGGAIAPGPDLLRAALGRGAAQLFEVEIGAFDLDAVPALGRESAEALRSGVVHGFRGAVRELVRRVASEAGLDGAPVVVAGGASPWLLADGGVFGGDVVVAAHVVHLGLLEAARGAGLA
ncbi:MAG: type III pantothenate kinase [Planctomycetota bacterium]